MAKEKSEARKQARLVWMKSGRKASAAEIAEQVGASPSLIRKWKSQDQWEKHLRPLKGDLVTEEAGGGESNTAPKKPRKNTGLLGNQNAKGNHGGAPKGSKNALKTGQYETIKYSMLTDDELQLRQSITFDKIQMQKNLIMDYEVREYRMLKRLAELRTQEQDEQLKGMVNDSVTISKRGEKGKPLVVSVRKNIQQRITEIEISLSVVQKQKQAAIEALHKMETDDTKLQMEREKIAAERQETAERLEIERQQAGLHGEPTDPNLQIKALYDLLQNPVQGRELP